MSIRDRWPAAARLVAIRGAYLLGVAGALLWAPVHHGIHPDTAYTPLGDLIFGSLDRWDAGWFLRIARHGYDIKQSAAFFPVYPLVVRGVAFVVRSHLVAGVLVSLASAAVAAELLLVLARRHLPERAARDSILLLALYPLAFVFTSVYSDALFLMFALAAFVAAERGNALLAGVAGALAVGTRLVGLALLPALAILLWRHGRARLTALLLLPAALGLYALYLHEHFGDAGAFVHSEGEYWERHTTALGPLQGLWDSLRAAKQGAASIVRHLPSQLGYPKGYEPSFTFAIWNVVHFLLLVLAVWLTWVAWKKLGAAYAAYSAATLIIVLGAPAEVVPLVSIPRFLLADFPLFLALAALAAPRPRLREALLVGFGTIGGAAIVAFAHGVGVA